MSPHDYLFGILRQQDLRADELDELRRARERIEACLRGKFGNAPRFYYAGSFGKRTMNRASYDLDIVIYWPHTETKTLYELFWETSQRLVACGYSPVPRTVALRIQTPKFHIDVVPGKAQDATFKYATLFKNTNPSSTLQTSLKVHIEAIKGAGLSDIVRLTKLWRLRHGLSIATFPLEISVSRAMKGRRREDLAVAMRHVFAWLADDLPNARLEDPANTNNIIDVPSLERLAVSQKARAALQARTWEEIIW